MDDKITGTHLERINLAGRMESLQKDTTEKISKMIKAMKYAEMLEELAASWCKPRKYVWQKNRRWRRWASIGYNEYGSEIKLTLYMADSDSIKTTIKPYLEMFLDQFISSFVYTENEKVEYKHLLEGNRNDGSALFLIITADAKHSSVCKKVPTGKMIPEMKFECK